jgi:hypothetical protein
LLSLIAHRPFTLKSNVNLLITCQDTTFGFKLAMDTATQRFFISDFDPKSRAESLFCTPPATGKKFLGAFITAIHDTPIFAISDVKQEF